jgi:hypothetical protein
VITVIRNTSGNYNILGTNDGAFTLMGNLTLELLRELKAEVDRAIKEEDD